MSITRFHCFAVIVALASGMKPLPPDEDGNSDETPISKEVCTSLEKSPCLSRLENVRDKVCDLEITGVLMFDYANAVPVYCNGHEWLSLPGENGATVTKPDAKPIGSSPDNPGKSCDDIKENAKKAPSGVYWINPNPDAHRDSFQIYCEMSIDGGSWHMCYTTDSAVRLKTEKRYDPRKPYGTVGYRADCSGIPFDEVLYVDHENGHRAWFSKQSSGSIVAARTNYDVPGSSNGLWSPHGVAPTDRNYQFLLCDNSDNSKRFFPGFFISGYTGCYKQCNNWCGDASSPYFRTDGDFGGGSYDGVAFNVNGHRPLGKKRMSVGIRLS